MRSMSLSSHSSCNMGSTAGFLRPAHPQRGVTASKLRVSDTFNWTTVCSVVSLFSIGSVQRGQTRSFTAAGFQRLFAEAARVAQCGELYLFFIRRALEVAPRMLPPRRGVYQSTFARYWLAIRVLCHEGAHALAPDLEMRKALENYAALSASSMMNEMIVGLTGKLNNLLDGEPVSEALQKDLENWSVTWSVRDRSRSVVLSRFVGRPC